jgi:hypothetical protein
VLRREVLVVNLDPAVEEYKYECAVDIRDLVTVVDVMDQYRLGPNGALVYCLEFLLENFDWLEEQLDELPQESYLLFDCPG